MGEPVLDPIGRDAELSALGAALAAAGSGASAALLVTGPPGMGKTTLVDAAVRGAVDRGMTVLRARAVEAELELPFAGLHELLIGQADARAALEPHHASA